MSSPVTYEQFDFVQKLLSDFIENECFIAGASGSKDERVETSLQNARRRAEFERLFVREDD